MENNVNLFVVGLVFLAFNLIGMKNYFKLDEQKEKDAQDVVEQLERFLGEERAYKFIKITAVFLYSLYVMFYLLGFVVFNGILILKYLPVIMIALTIYNLIDSVNMAKTKNFKVGFNDKIGWPATFMYTLLYLYFCFGKVSV